MSEYMSKVRKNKINERLSKSNTIFNGVEQSLLVLITCLFSTSFFLNSFD